MSIGAWIAVGVVAWLVAGAVVLGVVLGLSPPEWTEWTKFLDGVQMLMLIVIWPAMAILGIVVVVATPIKQWREETLARRDHAGTKGGDNG
jgi:purine-cytosine permease-like protein